MAMQAGSYLEFSVPFVVEESGYTTRVYGQAMNVDCTTSLPFRDFIKCETLEVMTSYHNNILLSLSQLERFECLVVFLVESRYSVRPRLERTLRLDSCNYSLQGLPLAPLLPQSLYSWLVTSAECYYYSIEFP